MAEVKSKWAVVGCDGRTVVDGEAARFAIKP